MAKRTALQLVNKVLQNLGESQETVLTSLTGLSLLVFDTINELLYDLAFEYKSKLLEKPGTITLTTGIGTVALPSDFFDADRKSFRYDESKAIAFFTPDRMDREYPIQTSTGIPERIYRFAEVWNIDPIPSSGANAKTIKYRYWGLPTILETATPTGTCWIPEGFDLTLLCDYVTYKIMHYKHNEEAAVYYSKVWGDGRLNEGSLSKFRTLYGSEIAEGNIMVEPM